MRGRPTALKNNGSTNDLLAHTPPIVRNKLPLGIKSKDCTSIRLLAVVDLHVRVPVDMCGTIGAPH